MPVLVLSSGSDEVAIKDADQFIFMSSGWPSEEAARLAADKYVPALARTLARLRIGVDFGDRAPEGGGFAPAVIESIWQKHGVRVINETPGVMVYESEPAPAFASSSGSVGIAVHSAQFEQVFQQALQNPEPLLEEESVGLGLFNASFFQKSADSRFLMLVMALEAVLELNFRSASAVAHVEELIAATEDSALLTAQEKNSICGSLRWLRRDSTSHAGKMLVTETLGDRQYMGMQPAQFFAHCYSLRSRLAHGAHPLPTRQEIGVAAANLEVLVSDMFSGGLRDVDLHPVASG